MRGRVAYLMSRFPHLPETFILREMCELERCGWPLVLFPLILQNQSVRHREAESWISRAQRLPFVSPNILKANARRLFKDPIRYGGLWKRGFTENLSSPYLLLRAILLFPKAIYAAQLMREQEVQHIHAHYATNPALVAWIIHQLTGISYSVTVHAHDIFVRTAMLATKLHDAAFIVAISNYNRAYLGRVVGPWVLDKTQVIHCGINPGAYKQHRPVRNTKFEILSIGSLQPYKGHRYLIRACAMLKERGIPLHCRIVGGGKERIHLAKQIAELHLDPDVELLRPQPQDQVAYLLPTADCYVQPSIVTPSGKMEGIPVALMEALACGLPAVATSLSGVPELIRHEETGYLVPPANARALADALANVYADPISAEQNARLGRALVLEEFDLQKNVAQLSARFEHVLAQSVSQLPTTSPGHAMASPSVSSSAST